MVSGIDVVEAIRKKRTRAKLPNTDAQLATYLGMNPARLSAFKKHEKLTPLQIANMLHRVERTTEGRARSALIRPIVEFFHVDAVLNERGGVSYELFDVSVEGQPHPYREGLKKQLCDKSGIYIFYDSRGCALYVGQASGQRLWAEMRAAFNRDRQDLQTISKVRHPESRIAFRLADEKDRQIVRSSIPLRDVAHYFGAYEVPAELIGDMEAFLIRAFANDLLNKKKEKIGRRRQSQRGTAKPRAGGAAA